MFKLLKLTSFIVTFSISSLIYADNHGPSDVDPNQIADILERSKVRGKIIACADPYGYPYALQNGRPPGFDVEIMEKIATRNGMRLEMYWADTASRGGLSRGLRRSILKGRCDVFMGVSESGDDDQLMGKLTFAKQPYLGMGYVLVTQGNAKKYKSLEELKEAGVKVGVPMSTPIDDLLFTRKIPRELYLDNRRIMRGMAEGEINAALVWATAVSVALREFPDLKFEMAEGYVPEKGQRWNLQYMVRRSDRNFSNFLDDNVKALLKDGTIKEIVEKYNVPFFEPFDS